MEWEPPQGLIGRTLTPVLQERRPKARGLGRYRQAIAPGPPSDPPDDGDDDEDGEYDAEDPPGDGRESDPPDAYGNRKNTTTAHHQ